MIELAAVVIVIVAKCKTTRLISHCEKPLGDAAILEIVRFARD